MTCARLGAKNDLRKSNMFGASPACLHLSFKMSVPTLSEAPEMSERNKPILNLFANPRIQKHTNNTTKSRQLRFVLKAHCP